VSSKSVQTCVSRGFEKYKGDPKFEAKTQKQKLGFLFGICRANAKAKSDFVNDYIDDFVLVDDALPGIDVKQPSAIRDLQSLLSSVQAPYALQDETTGYTAAGVLTFTNRPMTPVTSSNVKGVGVFNNDLLVQFWGTQGTYRYHFDTPKEALEASQHMTSGSPGRYVWNHLRGRQIGPAYFSGKPTPGGTSASIVPYDIAGRTPMPKVPDYDKIAKMLHEYKMAVKKPPISGEPFTPEEILAKQRLDIFTEIQKMLGSLGVKGDFVVDDAITLKGPITRGGEFWYPEGWEEKDYWQLKELYDQFGFLPAYDKHSEDELIGFGSDWEFIDPTDESPDGYINAEVVIFDDIIKKYKLKKKDLIDIPVSVRQRDDSANYEKRQNITDLFHIAVDLKGEMLDRCSLKGGRPCRVSIVNDGIKIARGSISRGKGVASGLVKKFKKLGSDVTRFAIKNYIKEDKLMPNKKDKKDEKDDKNIKDDQAEGADVHTGPDTTGFGYVGDRDQFMSACRQSGGSEASCAETWTKKIETGTGAKGVPKQGEPDIHKYDFAEKEKVIDSKMAELDAKMKKVDDFLEVQEKVIADAEAKEATEIREFLTKKYGKEKCDFVDDLDLPGLRAAKMSAEFMETKLKKDFDMHDKSDGVEYNQIQIIDDFEGYIDTKMEGIKKSKFGWGVTQEDGA